MRFGFKTGQQDAENKDQLNLTILSHKTAYNRLIQHINKRYWALNRVELDFLDHGLMEDPEVIDLQMGFYLPKKDGALHEDSKSAGKIRLIEFLRCVYIVQSYTPSEEGCLPLLQSLDGVLMSKKGHHFPVLLADTIKEGVFMAVRLKPHESTVTLSGDLARQGRAIMSHLKIHAEERYKQYYGNSSTDLFNSACC